MADTSHVSPFTKVAFISVGPTSARTFYDYDFLLVLDGSVRISREDEVFFLSRGDVFLCEAGYQYNVVSGGSNVILSVVADRRFFLQGQPLHRGCFQCNSAADSTRDYEPLRQILTRIAADYFKGGDNAELRLCALAYDLLYCLNTYHYVASSGSSAGGDHAKVQRRIAKITAYIHQSYATPVTLQAAAEQLELSAPYLSSFFKKHMGTNFNAYVNQVRLEHAVDELVYTDHSITSIIFDNGFPSANAFNKLFKEKYQVTPNIYRQRSREDRPLEEVQQTAVAELPSSDYVQLLESNQNPSVHLETDVSFPAQVRIEVEDMSKSTPVEHIWKKLINVGSLIAFSHRDINQQLEQIQHCVGFEYGRVGHVLDPRLFADSQGKANRYHFAAFDILVDSFEQYRLIPYLDLTIPIELLQTENDFIQVDQAQYLEMLEGLIQWIANAYGPDEVSGWYFEISPHRNLSTQRQERPAAFARRFFAAYKLIQEYLPGVKIGGLCHDALFDFNLYRQVLSQVAEAGIEPDFVSLGAYPFEPFPGSQARGICYSRDVDYIRHKLEEFKAITAQYLKKQPKYHVAYMAPDRFSGYYLNDTMYQGCFLFHNTVELIGQVDMLGYYRLSDISSPNEGEIRHFLAGKAGLLNRYGIRKPGFHVLEVLSRCRDNLVSKGSDYVILRGTPNRFAIGLCNYTHVGDSDSYSINRQIPVQDAYKIYEEPQTKKIELKLNNMEDGDYDVILFQINKQHGSIMDEWARNGYWRWVAREDLDYFRNIDHPLRTRYKQTVVDGTMSLQFQLAPHEVLFLILLQRY